MQSGWLQWVAMVAVTRLCDKKQQVALLLKGVTVGTYRAEEVITQLKSAHTKDRRTIDTETKPQRNIIAKTTLKHPINRSYSEENVSDARS